MAGHDLRSARIRNAVVFATVATLSLLAEGCSSNRNVDKAKVETGDATVTGKVTLQGQPVAGSIVFAGRNHDQAVSKLGAEGAYTIEDAPMGEIQVLIFGPPSSTNRPPAELAKFAGSNGGVAPPKKYETPNELKLTVTEGRQVRNFELTP